MKTLAKIFFALFLGGLIIPGCNQNPEIDKINRYLVCKNECDEKYEQYRMEYENCKDSCWSEYLEKVMQCADRTDTPRDRAECRRYQVEQRDKCLAECEKLWNKHMDEIRQCRAECNELISIKGE